MKGEEEEKKKYETHCLTQGTWKLCCYKWRKTKNAFERITLPSHHIQTDRDIVIVWRKEKKVNLLYNTCIYCIL